MHQAIIIANGKVERPASLSTYIHPSSVIIAVDGGLYNCTSLDIQPDVIIGDLDSLNPEELLVYHERGVNVIQYPTHKDETDLELALQYTLKHKMRDVIIVGGLGARWDMTIANILLLANAKFKGMNIRFLDGHQEIYLLRAGDRSVIHGEPGDVLSLIPINGDVTDIITRGLEYPLNDSTLQFGTARGVSNVFILEQVDIFYKQGLLLCIVHRREN